MCDSDNVVENVNVLDAVRVVVPLGVAVGEMVIEAVGDAVGVRL